MDLSKDFFYISGCDIEDENSEDSGWFEEETV